MYIANYKLYKCKAYISAQAWSFGNAMAINAWYYLQLNKSKKNKFLTNW